MKSTLLGLCAVLLACGGEAELSGTASTVTYVDGVQHVRLSALPPTGAPRLEAEEVFTTLEGVELFQVAAGRLLDGGGLALANAGTSEVLVFGREGELELRIGGKGEGPGEFEWISALDVDSAGHILAYDPRLGRLTRAAADGSGVEVQRLSPPNNFVDLEPLAWLADGRIAAVYGDMRMFQASGEARDTIPLMLFDSEGESVDTVGLWPATEWAFVSFSRGASRAEVGFGGAAAYSGRNGRFAIGSTDTLDITVFGADGLPAMRIAGGGARTAVESADAERWRQELLESRSRGPEELRRAIADFPYRSVYPAFGDLVVDDSGRLWIGAYARPTASARDWVVIGTDGSVEGVVSLPASARILDIAGDRIALLDRDALDEEYVSVLALSR